MRLIKDLRGLLGNGRGERGIVLVASLLVMLVLMPLGALFLTLSLTETTIASNEVNATNTFNIAEAGLEHARRELVDVGINTTLATCTGTPCIAQINFTNGGQNVSFAGGTYSVAVQDDADDADPTVDSNDEVMLTATGTYKDATQVIEATVGRARFQGGSIITGGDLAISGNPTANGPYGSFHANGDLTVSGNPTVSQNLSASGTYSVSGSPTVGGYEG
ncbi:MAG: PilX N-terminal domain-containing pilus assembly protein, partial [Anaerolineae bacterium]